MSFYCCTVIFGHLVKGMSGSFFHCKVTIFFFVTKRYFGELLLEIYHIIQHLHSWVFFSEDSKISIGQSEWGGSRPLLNCWFAPYNLVKGKRNLFLQRVSPRFTWGSEYCCSILVSLQSAITADVLIPRSLRVNATVIIHLRLESQDSLYIFVRVSTIMLKG